MEKQKTKKTVALSISEAEYMALSATIQECMYLIQLLKGIEGSNYMQPQVYGDNQGAIALAGLKTAKCTVFCRTYC